MDDHTRDLAVDINWRNLALGHPTFTAEGATFVRNPNLPKIYDANFVYNAATATPDEIDSLIARARKEYVHASSASFRLDHRTPPELEARLALDGEQRGATLVMLLERDLLGPPPAACDIRPLDTDAGWDAYGQLKRADWADRAPHLNEDPADTTVPDGLTSHHRLGCPPNRYFMAYVDNTPVGFFNAWEGHDGIGQVEDLFVLPAFRRRGIAHALIHHCVADARAHGAGSVVICADPADTPKHIYANLGWRPIALTRQFALKH